MSLDAFHQSQQAGWRRSFRDGHTTLSMRARHAWRHVGNGVDVESSYQHDAALPSSSSHACHMGARSFAFANIEIYMYLLVMQEEPKRHGQGLFWLGTRRSVCYAQSSLACRASLAKPERCCAASLFPINRLREGRKEGMMGAHRRRSCRERREKIGSCQPHLFRWCRP